MRLIINADDFGYDADTVAATIARLEDGTLTSATIMARMPETKAAIDYARKRPDISFGVHLTYVCDTVEAPVCPASEVPALVRPDGRFLTSNTVRMLAVRGQIPVSQIICETQAQLSLIRDHGLVVSHVDSHGHLHKFRPFRAALEEVLPRFGIRRVRAVQNIYLRRPWTSPTYWLGALWGAGLRRRFATTDYFFMSASAGDANWSHSLIDRQLPGVVEVGVHPGLREEWRRNESMAAAELAALARARGHELITWHAV